jgi:NADH-ubiquinone oxidoreductase chain 5
MKVLANILPTPVSALIHAACLVTAGVYLLLRSSPILEYGSTPLILITWVGALTAFFAATTGLLQNDLKRVIAYSTMSQMGYLIMSCGLSQYNFALFHLVNHAFFKALLFLAAGSIIHALNDEQDIRKMGGLVKLLPFSYTMLLIGSFSLMALPFLTGYYSKDLIIESAFAQYQFSGLFAFWCVCISAVFTALYSIRLLFLAFLGFPNGPKNNYLSAHEPPLSMAIPLVILAIFSIFFGYFASDLFSGVGTHFWGNALFVHPNHSLMIDMEFGLSTGIKLLPLIGVLFGVISLFVLYTLFPMMLVNLKSNRGFARTLYRLFNQKFFFDSIYTHFLINPALGFGFITSKVLDRGALEILGPVGLSSLFTSLSNRITSLDTESIPRLALFIVVNLCLLMGFIMFSLDPKYLILYLIAMCLI